MFSVVHPTGNQNVRAVLAAMRRHALLDSYITTLGFPSGSSLIANLPRSLAKQLSRRVYELPPENIVQRPTAEIARLLIQYLDPSFMPPRLKASFNIDYVYKRLDANASDFIKFFTYDKNLAGVYAYEDGACATFAAASSLGITKIYDLPIAYWRTTQRLLNEESIRLPDWRCTFEAEPTYPGKNERKEFELYQADVVVCPSDFVASSLPENLPKKDILVAPFGSPQSCTFTEKQSLRQTKGSKLRVLFVGSMSQRKGLADLLTAFRLLNRSDIELVIAGSPKAPLGFYRRHFPEFIYEAGRPHHEILNLMKSCDIFCLPSIVEGRALVLQEAMSQGLPIVITPNTGGSDLVVEGETGFIVPIRSPEAIAERIAWFGDNLDRLPGMSRNAQLKAAMYTWENYGDSIVRFITRSTQLKARNRSSVI